MKNTLRILLTALSLIALSPIAWAGHAGTSNVGDTQPQVLTFHVDEGAIKVYYGETTVYMLLPDPPDESDGGSWTGAFFYVEVLGAPALNNRVARIDDIKHIVKFESSNPKVISFHYDQYTNGGGMYGAFDTLAPGTAIISVSVDNQKQSIQMKVVRLPVRNWMGLKLVKERIGEADTVRLSKGGGQSFHHVGSEFRAVAMDDWLYDKYHGLVFTVDPLSGICWTDMVQWSSVEKRYNIMKGYEKQ